MRRKIVVSRRERCVPTRPNEVRSLEFVADQRVSTRLRMLPLVDVFAREALTRVGQRLRAEDVVAVLNRRLRSGRRRASFFRQRQ